MSRPNLVDFMGVLSISLLGVGAIAFAGGDVMSGLIAVLGGGIGAVASLAAFKNHPQ